MRKRTYALTAIPYRTVSSRTLLSILNMIIVTTSAVMYEILNTLLCVKTFSIAIRIPVTYLITYRHIASTHAQHNTTEL